jgi:hypothetical protein
MEIKRLLFTQSRYASTSAVGPSQSPALENRAATRTAPMYGSLHAEEGMYEQIEHS